MKLKATRFSVHMFAVPTLCNHDILSCKKQLIERRNLIQEQDRAYQASLEADIIIERDKKTSTELETVITLRVYLRVCMV